MTHLWTSLFCVVLGIFTVNGKGDDATVSANQNGVAADVALRELANTMNWGYRPATDQVVAELSKVSLDLSFNNQKPRITAQLIAMTAGMDVTFDDRTSTAGYSAIMHVSPSQSNDTLSRSENPAGSWAATGVSPMGETPASRAGRASKGRRMRITR